jgi:predicted small lipoprotein YifL
VIRVSKFICLAVLGAALAAGLSACGVKGPLDPPPSAAVDPTVPVAPAGGVAAGSPAPSPQAGPVLPGAPGSQVSGPQRTSTAVVQAPAAKQRSILDWLID